MKNLKVLFFLFIITNSMINTLSAQVKKSTDISEIPMYQFLRANADTTLILHHESNWLSSPEYYIISKKGDTISSYIYKSVPAIDKRIILPKNMANKLYKRNNLDILNTPLDINFYFNPNYLEQDTLRKFWQSIIKYSPWQIKDDSIEGKGCDGTNKDQIHIDDGGAIVFDLVTKSKIKRLYFYAPEFFENEICPGRIGRKKIIAISKLFSTYFHK